MNRTQSFFIRKLCQTILGFLLSVLVTVPVPITALTNAPNIREPAVAGLFYPKEKNVLSQLLEAQLKAVPGRSIKNLRALVCPHAGYVFSGPIAAHSYKLLSGAKYETAIVLAPSHYALFNGAYVTSADRFRTPLGEMVVSPKATALAGQKPFTKNPPARVHRPPWAAQASCLLPESGSDTPETWEHSLEVQIPFLQKVLPDANLIPVVMGETDAEQTAKVLVNFLDDQSILIASSDLSHYHPYDAAKKLDGECVKAVCELDLAKMNRAEACGKTPILTVMHLARMKGWQPLLLDYRNSGDTAGDKAGVVGYAAIAFYSPESEKFSKTEKQTLLNLARRTLKQVTTDKQAPAIEAKDFPARISEKQGCFVTLTINGELRGCIGHIIAQMPLHQAVVDNAISAALRDHRFPPVTREEVDTIEIEVSVLTEPKPLAFSSPEDLLKKLQPHKDGVVLKVRNRGATFLPQVWEQLPDKVEFLNHLSQKAGCPASAWREPGTEILIYHVEAFKESELK